MTNDFYVYRYNIFYDFDNYLITGTSILSYTPCSLQYGTVIYSTSEYGRRKDGRRHTVLQYCIFRLTSCEFF
jgi:hypothetical protein